MPRIISSPIENATSPLLGEYKALNSEKGDTFNCAQIWSLKGYT